MENKETIIEIKGISVKEGKTGNKYFSIETDQGAVTCFEKKITDELQKHVGQKVKVEIAENERGFRNLRRFLGVADNSEVVSQPKEKEKTDNEQFAEARAEKNKSMYVAYVKDLVVAGKPVEEAIDIVKYTIRAFEEKIIKEEVIA